MTAEIAIMNKDAVALAADSAVTINTGSGRKIYNTVNKLFALTKYAPVGIMVYGRADIMGIPWESIIKTYRPVIGSETFGTIDEYVSHFVSFLKTNSKRLFPPEIQLHYFTHLVTSAFLSIRNSAQESIKQIISNKGKASPSEVRAAIDASIEEYSKFVASKRPLLGITRARVTQLKRRYGKISGSVRSSVFQQLPLSSKARSRLSSIPFEICRRRVFSVSDSGVVIAGFGNDEIFPFLTSMVFGGVADNILRYEVVREIKIRHDNPAVIKPFAQSEMVEAFMEGVDPNCDDVINSYWRTIMSQFPNDVANAVPAINTVQKRTLIQKLLKAGDRILKEFREKLREYQNEHHINPVIDAVAVLPKDLLAEVAESLVNLTSFKRRISMTSAETVGGPIDVAVISRGDGFVWIKRKHYFRPELNPQFMSQYSGGLYGSPTPPKK
jgi:hypothetical protein